MPTPAPSGLRPWLLRPGVVEPLAYALVLFVTALGVLAVRCLS